MSRKDTIIIAVLINAGLLIVLFASALKSSTPEIAVAPKQNVLTETPSFKTESVVTVGDEVDQALQKMAATPPAAYTSPAVPSFAEDLKPFTPVIEHPAPQASLAAAPEEKEYSEIKVKKGDVLEKIARQHHTSVDAIIAYNQLGSTNLRIGQVLKIPSKKATQVQTPALAAQPKADGHKYYTVKTGDNPWTIAVKNHMKVEELLRINQLDQEKARKLKPGDKLLIQ
jgi:LysM repeat protein